MAGQAWSRREPARWQRTSRQLTCLRFKDKTPKHCVACNWSGYQDTILNRAGRPWPQIHMVMAWLTACILNSDGNTHSRVPRPFLGLVDVSALLG